MNLPRRLILSLLSATMLTATPLAAKAPAPAAPPSRPNILVIVADDLGYSDIGAFGGEIATPNLDALAARGLKLTGFHTAPTCSPTRSMLLTGLDNHEAGLGSMAESLAPNQKGQPGYEGYLRPDAATVAELLGGGGYRTLFAGKWHLGLTPEQDPSRRGFQSSFVLLQGAHNHFGAGISTDPAKGNTYRENGQVLSSLPTGFYSSDAFATRLVQQIGAEKGAREGGKPFFAYLAFSAPHWPLQAPPEVIAKYKGRYDDGYEALRDRRLKRQVELGLLDPKVVPHAPDRAPPWASLSAEQKALFSRRMEVYAAMVDRLDQNVGRVVQTLKERGEFDNTVILFLADNGAEGLTLTDLPDFGKRAAAADNSLENLGKVTSYDAIGPGWAEAATAPSWRYKAFETEGGTRVVSFIAGPGVRQGVAGAFTSVMDVTPTLLDLAGVAQPRGSFAGRAVKPIRGLSWSGLLSGKAARVYPADRPVAAELFGGRAVRQGDWKLTDRGDGQWRLFDIARDPGETADLAARQPARVAALARAWDAYAREVGVIIADPPNPLINRK